MIIFNDTVMFALFLSMSVFLIVISAVLILRRLPNWWWTVCAAIPSILLTWYYSVLALDPEIPELRLPGPGMLESVFRPALAWLVILSVLNLLYNIVSEVRRSRGGGNDSK